MNRPTMRELVVAHAVLTESRRALATFLRALQRRGVRDQRNGGFANWFKVEWPAAVRTGRRLRPLVIVPTQCVLDAAATAQAARLESRGVHRAAAREKPVKVRRMGGHLPAKVGVGGGRRKLSKADRAIVGGMLYQGAALIAGAGRKAGGGK